MLTITRRNRRIHHNMTNIFELHNNTKPVSVSNEDTLFETIKETIQRVKNNLDNEQVLYELVSKYYGEILDAVFDDNDKDAFIVLTHKNYLKAYLRLLCSCSVQVNITRRINTNSLVYDFLRLKTRDASMDSIMMAIAKAVNKPLVASLSLVLPEAMAIRVAIARYSTASEMLSVKRVNKALMSIDSVELITEQATVDIYSKLYTRVTNLFEGVMFDVFEDFRSKDSEIIYSTTGLAALDILESLPMADIQKVLMSYHGDKVLDEKPFRFRLSSIAYSDYPRILDCIYHIQQTEGIIII